MKQLQSAIDTVNRRYASGLNDDDAVSNMCAIDKKTKGYTFQPRYDTYELCTDYDRLKFLADKHGYWSSEVEYFNSVLRLKGTDTYKVELNNKYLAEIKETV